jgi:phosphatidylglycerophosphatase A
MPSLTTQCIVVLIVTAIGTYSTARFLASDLNRSITSRKPGDPGVVVIDEWAGMMLTLISTDPPSLTYYAAGFFLFRLFDVLKPGPVDWLQRLPGAWGVMLDDIGAGALALLVLSALSHFVPL